MKSTWLWSLWQAILLSTAMGFTRRGEQRFVEWATGLALNVEEHTITQSCLAIERPADWRAIETFAEYGAWRADCVTGSLARQIYAIETVERLYNLYGPTEDTVYSTFSPVPRESRGAPTIGRPIANTQASV